MPFQHLARAAAGYEAKLRQAAHDTGRATPRARESGPIFSQGKRPVAVLSTASLDEAALQSAGLARAADRSQCSASMIQPGSCCAKQTPSLLCQVAAVAGVGCASIRSGYIIYCIATPRTDPLKCSGTGCISLAWLPDSAPPHCPASDTFPKQTNRVAAPCCWHSWAKTRSR